MNPDEILQQISDLVQQYLALPGDTPLKAEFSSLQPMLEQATTAPSDQPDMGMPPGGEAMPPGGAMPPDQAGPQGNLADILGGAGPQGPPPSTGDSFKDATTAASGAIKESQKETGTKTGVPEQFSKNRKRSKAQ